MRAGGQNQYLADTGRRVDERFDHCGDICTRHRASIDGRLCKKDFTGGVVVCQKSWPKNRPIQRSPCLQVFLRCRLRPQVGGKNLVGVLRYFVTSTHGADLNEPTHSRFLGGIGQQHRRSSVYGILPLDRAARSGARGEDRDVGTVEYLRNFLDVEDSRSITTGNAPSVRTAPSCAELRISATGRSPCPASRYVRCCAILPCPPAMTTRVRPHFDVPSSFSPHKSVLQVQRAGGVRCSPVCPTSSDTEAE